MSPSITLKSLLAAITQLTILGIAFLGTWVDRIPLDAQILVVLVALQIIAVYQERIERVQVGPVDIDLSEGVPEVKEHEESNDDHT